jgi:hypothetical protein
MFDIEPAQEMLWPAQVDAFRELSIILITKAQRQILVAAEREQLISIDVNGRDSYFALSITIVTDWTIFITPTGIGS